MLHTDFMSTARKLDRPATMEDLEALPPDVKGEIIDGALYVMPKPRPHHSHAQAVLTSELEGPFGRARGGPGGWWILVEPGIGMPGAIEVAPDLAGWRRERMPTLPNEQIKVVPDWLCEILSPSTRAYDRRVKLPYYARVGVSHVWVVDPEARTLEVKRLENERWVELAVFAEGELVRAEPFDAIEIALGDLWAPAE